MKPFTVYCWWHFEDTCSWINWNTIQLGVSLKLLYVKQCPISNFISYQFLLIIRKISKVVSKVEQMNSFISLRGSIICMSDIWILRSRTITFTIFSVKLKVINTHLLFHRDIKLTWLGIVLTVFKTCLKCGIGNVVLIQTYLCIHQLNEFCLILLE